MADEPLLELRGVNQYYGGSHTLRGIDLTVPEGACLALLGRNGVGKTTLLRCMMGQLPIRSGSVRFAGREITKLKSYERARLGIGWVPQGREIFPRLTVAENLKVSESAAAGRQLTPLKELEALFPILRSMERRRGGDLSGGQQQQLAIARALVPSPRLLLLDEPTEGIQPSTIKEIERVLRALLAKKMTVVLVEQYLDFATALADHYAIVSRGEIVERGLMKDLKPDQVSRYLAV
ncbi:MAG TPA: urea ABC transporter ATP-binding subunit UrtE [Myxococcales bacterium]|nr:urea ABC transporter ATP-binding subunit UrtE [Myxococcales bacterium]